MALGDMSQILQHMKGECRSGRCIIELSFDNQVTFEVFRNHCSTKSTIKRYLQVNAVDLQLYVPTRHDDDRLYYHTNPDGLCSVRSALISERYTSTASERLPSDVMPMNARNQYELASYVRGRVQSILLSTDEFNFVEKALTFIENYDLGQSPPATIWPSEEFLYKWVNVPWCFYNNTTMHHGSLWDQMRAVHCGTIVQKEKFLLAAIGSCHQHKGAHKMSGWSLLCIAIIPMYPH